MFSAPIFLPKSFASLPFAVFALNSHFRLVAAPLPCASALNFTGLFPRVPRPQFAKRTSLVGHLYRGGSGSQFCGDFRFVKIRDGHSGSEFVSLHRTV